MSDIFSSPQFEFPYTEHRFPGQNSDETILFVVRENESMLWFRRVAVFGVGLAIILSGWLVGTVAQSAAASVMQPEAAAGSGLAALFSLVSMVIALVAVTLGWWWMQVLWSKSICIVTTKRLTKFVYTTPVNRHTLSLPLDMIVDTGSYTKGFLQAALKLGTFTARSSASSSGVATDDGDRINKKYFYIENVAIAEDLQQYINKLLTTFRSRQGNLEGFRPFIPHLKGAQREHFMQAYPEYWS